VGSVSEYTHQYFNNVKPVQLSAEELQADRSVQAPTIGVVEAKVSGFLQASQCNVTVIDGVMGSEAELITLAQQLEKLCGSGGTVRSGIIEVQGDHCDKVMAN